MRELLNTEETVRFCKALSSPLRVEMLQYILAHEETSPNDLAEAFGVSRAAVTQNLRLLTEAGLVSLCSYNSRASQKKTCFLRDNKFVITLGERFGADTVYQAEIPIGQYTDYRVFPTCGIATPEFLIGKLDDPRYFDSPQRTEAGILWLMKGYVEYRLPNYLKENQRPTELQISLELSSEAPGVSSNWPSDISFWLNDILLCSWTSPGDFGEKRGIFTPDWWSSGWNQYGLLKLLTVSGEGTFMDGRKMSGLTIHDLSLSYKSEMRFRIGVPDTAKNIGGMTIFGKGFGNYDQNIRMRLIFETLPEMQEAD